MSDVFGKFFNNEDNFSAGSDYSEMDITRSTGTEEGIKIAEAHGFEMVRCEDIKNSDLTDILMISKDRSAFLHARAKKDVTIAYDGCDVMAVGCINDLSNGFGFAGLNCNSEIFGDNISGENPYSNYRIFECSYDKGCFVQYDKVKHRFPVKFEEIPWEQAPVAGVACLPVPKVIKFKDIIKREEYFPIFPINNIGMVLYMSNSLVNMILFAREIYPNLPEDVRNVYRVYKNPYDVVAKRVYIFTTMETVASIGIAFQYLNLPKDEENKYLDTIKQFLLDSEKGSFDEERMTSLINEEWPDIKGKRDTWVELLKIFIPGYEPLESSENTMNTQSQVNENKGTSVESSSASSSSNSAEKMSCF